MSPHLHFYNAIALALCALTHASAYAENYALIMTIDYANAPDPKNRMPPAGIRADATMALQMAQKMGVPDKNIIKRSNGLLILPSMNAALTELTQRIRPGDKVFIYYSGHGVQYLNTSGVGGKCTEAIYTADFKFFPDASLDAALTALTAKASEVVMFNDSCYSGGQITRNAAQLDSEGAVAKMVVLQPKSGSANDLGYTCGEGINDIAWKRAIEKAGKQASRPRLVYLAAAADNELAFALPRGSRATLAWHQCMNNRGMLTGNSMKECAQEAIKNDGSKAGYQTISLLGDGNLPLSFTSDSTQPKPAATPAAAPTSLPANLSNALPQPAPTSHEQKLEALRQKADPAMPVTLTIQKNRLKINADLLQFSVEIRQGGFLYLLHIGTDGFLYQLFPNALDSQNHLSAGRYEFPRANWGIKALGPAGTGYFMAYLSSTPRDFTKGMDKEGVFAKAAPDAPTMRTLGVTALNGRYGASRVATIVEVH